MTHKRELEERTERALEQIRESRLSDDESRQIADRVWERLQNRSDAAEAAEIGTIHGCDDYQALIPAFLAGSLAPSRSLLLEEHTRHCVPCRRALKAARAGDRAGRTADAGRRPSGGRFIVGRWAAAAALAIAALGTAYFVWNAGPTLPYGAVVEAPGAGVYRAATLERLEPGDRIAVGEQVRTAPGESSIISLADGSRVEVRGRSELAVESARRGTTVRVDRGSVIVEASAQNERRLYVSTDDCLVSVQGTIFAVSHGTRGSRVTVIQGEVHVDYAGAEKTLLAGQRAATYATYASYQSPGTHDELAWSQGFDRYLELLREVSDLRETLQRELPRPGLRYSSRLLDLAPDDLVFYAAFPNLVETLVEADRIVQERVGQSQVLQEWWNSGGKGHGFGSHMELTSKLSEAGGYLGDEIVVTGSLDERGDINGPIILAELTDPQALRAWLEQTVAEEDGDMPSVVFIEGVESPIESGGDALYVWLGSDTLVAAPRADLVLRTAGRAGLAGAVGSGLKARIAEVYREGAETLVAMDAREIAASLNHDDDPEAAARVAELGILDASHMIFQQKRFEDRTDNTAVLAFDGPRTGIASWLAEPAPMGSLRYVSPDAKLVASAILTDPAIIADQLMVLSRDDDGSPGIEELEARLGLSLKDDFAAALGGEFALALDGPVVPEPAWKMVVEVYDPDKLIYAIGQVLVALNDERAQKGLEPLELTRSEAAGRTYYGIGGDRPGEFTFDEGYLIAAANRGLIDRAIRYRQSGYTLETSSRFVQLMPADGRENFSAFVYQDAIGLIAPLAERIAQGSLTPEQQSAIESLRGQAEPTLAYAYAEESRIVFAAAGAMDLLTSGLPGLIGLGGLCVDGMPALGQEHGEDAADPVVETSSAIEA